MTKVCVKYIGSRNIHNTKSCELSSWHVRNKENSVLSLLMDFDVFPNYVR